MNARQIIEAIDDPSGLIHPEKHQAFSQRTHPLGKHPAYPDYQPQPGEKATNYEEVLASKQWQKILQKAQKYLGVPLTQQALGVIQRKLLGAMQLIDEVENEHREELQALAIDLVFELPEYRRARQAYESGRFKIDAQITDEISLEGAKVSEEPGEQAPDFEAPEGDFPGAEAPQAPARTPAEEQWMGKMVQRRHFTNAMIQGSAVSNDFLFEMGGAQLDRIHPGLRQAYGILMISTELGYWMFPQSAVIAGAKAQTQVGSSEVTFADADEDEDRREAEANAPEDEPQEPQEPQQPQQRVPVVKARGMTLPVLIQEIIKGMTELASLPSLPRDAQEREEVINQADLVDMEAWHMILGPKLWDSFIEATDAENERELTMHLYRHIQQMDVDRFNAFMKEVLAKSPQGIQMLRQLAQKVKAELAGNDEVTEAELIIRTLLNG